MTMKLKHSQIVNELRNPNVLGWELCPKNQEKGRDALVKHFLFSDFSTCFSVMCRIAILAEKMNHHPEWFNVYNKLHIVLSTHDVGGVSKLDLEMAEEINSYVAGLTHQNSI